MKKINFHTVQKMMETAVLDKVFPAAELLVSQGTELLFHQSFGEAKENTIFDIASLTKPIVTSTLCLQAFDEGLLKPDQILASCLSTENLEWHQTVTLMDLLSHRSGLSAWQAYYKEIPLDKIGTQKAKQSIIQKCLSEKLAYKTKTKTIYSDLGFIILGAVLEASFGTNLDELFQMRIANALEMKNSFFRYTGCGYRI